MVTLSNLSILTLKLSIFSPNKAKVQVILQKHSSAIKVKAGKTLLRKHRTLKKGSRRNLVKENKGVRRQFVSSDSNPRERPRAVPQSSYSEFKQQNVTMTIIKLMASSITAPL